ncbi:MAG: TolC family protein [Tannerellaceae bacterium]|nr:TolC family protein [Tannerellaceae bacterium]
MGRCTGGKRGFLWRKVVSLCLVSGVCILPLKATDSIAVQQHPAVRASVLSYEAALARIPQAGAWQDPTVEIGVYPQFGRLPEVRLMQMLPLFGLRQAERTEAEHMASVAASRYQETAGGVILSLRRQWELLLRLNQEKSIRESDRRLLSTLQARARAALVTGEKLTDVLRLHLEIEEADSYLANLSDRMETEIRRYNLFLARPPETAVVLPDSLGLQALPMEESEAILHLRLHHPVLSMQSGEAAALEARREQERRKGYPMVGLGLEYRLAAMPASGARMNPEAMLMPMLSLSLPLYRSKYKAAARESRLLKEEALQRRQASENELIAELSRLYGDYRQSLRQSELLRVQAEILGATFDLLLEKLSTGSASLDELVGLRRLLLDNRLQSIEAVAEANLALVQIRKLTEPPLQVSH